MFGYTYRSGGFKRPQGTINPRLHKFCILYNTLYSPRICLCPYVTPVSNNELLCILRILCGKTYFGLYQRKLRDVITSQGYLYQHITKMFDVDKVHISVVTFYSCTASAHVLGDCVPGNRRKRNNFLDRKSMFFFRWPRKLPGIWKWIQGRFNSLKLKCRYYKCRPTLSCCCVAYPGSINIVHFYPAGKTSHSAMQC